MKYIVMECHPAFAVVMSEDGRFLKVANRHYEVGQTVTDVVEMRLPKRGGQSGRLHRWMLSAAAVAACAVLAFTVVLQQSQVAYASVYLRINPQVRIGVNRQVQVVELESANPDGTVLLDGYQYKNKTLDQVVTELVDRAIQMEYLKEGGRVSLKMDAQDAQWGDVQETEMRTALEQHLNADWNVQVDVDDWDDLLDPEEWFEDDDEDEDEDSDDDDSDEEEERDDDDADEDDQDDEDDIEKRGKDADDDSDDRADDKDWDEDDDENDDDFDEDDAIDAEKIKNFLSDPGFARRAADSMYERKKK